MIMKFLGIFLSAFVGIFIVFWEEVFAHPGNTAADGCHYCRTNCDKWGEAWNQRHCHGGSSSFSFQAAEPAIPDCPTNSFYDSSSKQCSCYAGYAPSLSRSRCIEIPLNAHAVDSKTDVWRCNSGYEEVANGCIAVKKANTITKSERSKEPSCPYNQYYSNTKKKCYCKANAYCGYFSEYDFTDLLHFGGFLLVGFAGGAYVMRRRK